MENVCEKGAAGKLCRQDVTIIHSDSSCFLRMVLSRAWCLRNNYRRAQILKGHLKKLFLKLWRWTNSLFHKKLLVHRRHLHFNVLITILNFNWQFLAKQEALSREKNWKLEFGIKHSVFL